MPSRMRHGLFISLVVASLSVVSFNTSYADTTNYSYDELNRLIRVEFGDGTKTIYTYDQTGNRSEVYVGQYTLTVGVVGGGTVTKNPDQPIYSAGSSVTLTAVNGLQGFTEWSGDLTGNTNPTGIVMNGNKSVTATFATPFNWLQGWTYRKAVTLSRASGAVTNYQMKLLVGESSGAVGCNVHCNGHILNSFNDLRFTTSDKTTLLDYWIESVTGVTPNRIATVWIEFDSIGTSPTTFYMYYGKADALSESNGPNTFILFDDFERGNDGDAIGGGWGGVAGNVKISTGQKFGGTRSGKWAGGSPAPHASISKTAGSSVYSILLRIYKTDTSISQVMHGNGSKSIQVYLDTSENIQYFDGYWNDTGKNCSINAWGLLEINNINFTAGTYDIYYNNSLSKSGATMETNSGTNNLIYHAGTNGAGNDTYLDNVIVRNWRSTEPAWGSWGLEETY